MSVGKVGSHRSSVCLQAVHFLWLTHKLPAGFSFPSCWTGAWTPRDLSSGDSWFLTCTACASWEQVLVPLCSEVRRGGLLEYGEQLAFKAAMFLCSGGGHCAQTTLKWELSGESKITAWRTFWAAQIGSRGWIPSSCPLRLTSLVQASWCNNGDARV